MPLISTATIYNLRDGTSETLPADQAQYRAYFQPAEWSLIKPPPLNWQFELPRYRLTKDLQPAEKSRFRHETPFTEIWSEAWQYGEHFLAGGSEITTTSWPHASMKPLTFGAEKILAFFIGSIKSRLTVSPWFNGQVRLDNGLSGPISFEIKSPKPQHFDTRPAA
jgi:hypothetical protein